MTHRDLERRLRELEKDVQDEDGEMVVVFEEPETGDWYDDPPRQGGERIDEAPRNADPLIVIRETLVESDWSPDR